MKRLRHLLFHKHSIIVSEGRLYCYGCHDYLNRSK